MYLPSFAETVLGLLFVWLAATWLSRREHAPAFTLWIPWAAGAVIVGALVAGSASVWSGPEASFLAEPAKRGAAWAILAALLGLGVAGVLTVARRAR
ncbi:MAG: hypothetical protein KTR31_05610 [Myxococcales bacterium]|nr:hypothetical protein [Myxococcales bacterium]